jgi:hypothetical protein
MSIGHERRRRREEETCLHHCLLGWFVGFLNFYFKLFFWGGKFFTLFEVLEKKLEASLYFECFF